ncbi:MAG: ASKHA domain-containing protein, partial [Halanaerobiales bacterium]
ERQVTLSPPVEKISVKLDTPTREDQRDYLRRLHDFLHKNNYKLKTNRGNNNYIINKLSTINKSGKITLTVQEGRIIELEEGDTAADLYGIAADIGTTTIALYLLDLNNGREVDVISLRNPQQNYGADVISRINFTLEDEKGILKLKEVLVKGLNNAISLLLTRNNLDDKDVYTMTIAGNTVMLHTLAGISAGSIARNPYIPVFTDSLDFEPSELGIDINPHGFIRFLPGISGYVGADIIGDLLVVDHKTDSWNLMIDIGTNGEIVLGKKGRLYSCSAAAGPAFEGANILFGMPGVPGAISEYSIGSNGQIDFKTVGNKQAKGICGSGLVDIIAALLRQGYLTDSGAIKSDVNLEKNQRENIVTYKGKKAFRVLQAEETAIEDDILLTQKDIREFQLAMGAIKAGIKILINEAEITYNQIETVYLAGGFGNYINAHNACYLSLLPLQLEQKIVRIGNGAGMGAKLYLLDRRSAELAEEIREDVSYIELSSRKGFQTEFMNSMYLGDSAP